MKNRIKDELKVRGITQKQLAEAVGMSEVGLSNAINGSASMQTIEKIAGYLNIESSTLICDEDSSPIALYEGELNIGDKVLSCAVLNNGMRLLTASAVFEAFDRPRKGKSSEGYRADRMPSFINANNLQPYVDEQLREWTQLVSYKDPTGVVKYGYNARILRGLCKVYLEARNAGILVKSQERFALIAESLLYALSDIGIVALVDEATGYNKEKNRAKDELQRILATFLNEEASKWVKTFPDSFFEMIYRMRNWNWTNTSKRPGVVGKWINDIVYERIAPQLLQELQTRNPKNEHGNRNHCHHQFLTEELGQPKLREHISGVMAIGRLSDNNWERFMRNLDKAYPRQYTQLELDLDFED